MIYNTMNIDTIFHYCLQGLMLLLREQPARYFVCRLCHMSPIVIVPVRFFWNTFFSLTCIFLCLTCNNFLTMYWIFFVTCFFLASNSNNIVALCNRRPYVNKIPLVRRSAGDVVCTLCILLLTIKLAIDNAVGSQFPSLYSSNTTATALSIESNCKK